MLKIFLTPFLIFAFAAASYGLTLQESIEQALKYNPSVVAARKKISAASAQLAQAAGSFLPSVKLDGNYGKSYTQPSTVQMTTITTAGAVTQTLTFGTDAAMLSRSLQASLSQPIFVPALFPGYAIAKKNFDVAVEKLSKAQLEITYDATVAFFGILKAEYLYRVAQESVSMSKGHTDQVRAMLAAGSATKSDILRSEVELVNSELLQTKAKNALDLARTYFNNVLNRDLEEAISLEEGPDIRKIPVIPELVLLNQTAFLNNPGWKEYILNKKIAEDNVYLARTGYLPSVLLTGKTGNNATEYPTYKTDVSSWSIYGAASWTLFDGFNTQNKVWEAAANLEAQKAIEEKVKNALLLEVRDAFFNFNSGVEETRSAQKAVEFAEENYKVSTLRYQAGMLLNIEVIDAQVALTRAKSNYYQAAYDMKIAKARVDEVIGKTVF